MAEGKDLDRTRRSDCGCLVRGQLVAIDQAAACAHFRSERPSGNGGDRRDPADPDLARTLRTFALVRANVGVELDEAQQALHDALALHMAGLAAAPDEDQLGETYATELAQAQLLARQGRHVEAARVADLARSGHLDELVGMLRAQRGP